MITKFNEYANTNIVDVSNFGVPDIVYHGTNNKFEKFSKKYINTNEPKGDYIGCGFFFTKYIETAKKYGKYIIKAKLNIKSPLTINNIDDAKKLRDSFGGDIEYFTLMKTNPKLINETLRNRGYDGLIDNLYNQYAVFDTNQIEIIS